MENIQKTIIQSNNGVNSNDSFRILDSNNINSKDQFSRKNSTLSNGSVQT